jgi:glycosyltransferase involved in cell wall biosynthesis
VLGILLGVVTVAAAAAGCMWPRAERRAGKPAKLAVVSHAVPPAWSGQAMVLARLFSRIAAERLVVITKADTPPAEGVGAWHRLPAEPWESAWLGHGLFGDLSVAVRVAVRGVRIASRARREGCDVIVACTGDLIDLPASGIACRLLRIPLVVYSFDDYLSQWRFSPPALRRARLLEPLVLRIAAAVIVPNEAAAAEIAKRWPGTPCVVRNPAWGPAAAKPAPVPPACTILYTGAVYHVNEGAFRTLIAGLDRAADLDPELVIYTAQDRDRIAAEGVAGPRVRVHSHVDPGVASDLQRSAAILFLGFSFDSTVPEIVRTSAPGKLGDYLASGVPILALSPAGSFLAEFLATRGCGVVVDRDSPEAVADAIRRLRGDAPLRESLVAAALACARREFTAEAAGADFLAAVEGAVTRR